MVVAEVPLWVVHPGSKNDGGILKAGNAASSSSGKHADEEDHWKERAEKSLSFLQTGGGGKCAIYSVDVHPNGTKFATGGGDGTVRIWNASSLFSKQRGSFGAAGNYESSDASDGGGPDVTNNGNHNSAEAAPAEAAPSMMEESSSSDDDPQDVVHDLNKLVRRKKGGSTPSKAPQVDSDKAPEETTKNKNKPWGSIPSSSSPTKQHKQHTTPGHHNHHRLLTTLSAHTGSSVLAVRFSTNGQYLASAGDDACVCVYTPTKSSAASGNLMDSKSTVEHWARIKLCRGHTLDVVGLAWAPDDSHLVSCSLDSDAPIIVWKLTDLAASGGNSRKADNILCNPYKILGKNIHTSTVKGVTFDPAGTYLASSGDDPAVCIWRAHDDWGLERRVDASSGIFRSWNKGEEDVRELSSQTLFRRLSWSTDGSYICSTNATVKNKHVASTISREGWSVSGANSAASGAANLIGHKQPVVVSRHSPYLLDARKSGGDDDDDDNDDDEPEYATLIALGDKRGFVTVWSTRKSRPIFKLQCSESKRTVTDLTWGRFPDGKDLMLLVSLMDGHVVALRFGVPGELGSVLSAKDQSRVFRLRYGIDLDDDDGLGGRRMFVGDNSGPKLIENALQFTLEEQNNDDDDFGNADALTKNDQSTSFKKSLPLSNNVKVNQLESRSKATGKKRIRPVLMSVDPDEEGAKKNKAINGTIGATTENGDKAQQEKKKADPIQDALEAAAKAASAAEDINAMSSKRELHTPRKMAEGTTEDHSSGAAPHEHRQLTASPSARLGAAQIPHSTNRIHSVDLPQLPGTMSTSLDDAEKSAIVADCTNAVKVPAGSLGNALPCATLSISRGGKRQWKDEIYGTSCSVIAAAESTLAIGTADGCIYLYGTSPTLGWQSVAAFRSHPPIIVGNAVVALHLNKKKKTPLEEQDQLEMLVVTSDGMFGVYNLLPEAKVLYKGSILQPMTHMALSSTNEQLQPRLARIQVTESEKLLLILSLQSHSGRSASNDHGGRSGSRGTGVAQSAGVGGSLQAFVYHRAMELWMRVSDSRFVLSDFYSALPITNGAVQGVMSRVDDMVRSGSTQSSLKPSHRGRQTSDGQTSAMYNHAEDEGATQDSNTVTRAHCEDRMACALGLGSDVEFKYWLTLFVRTLAMGGYADNLRLVVDLLLGNTAGTETVSETASSTCWWLSSASKILNLDRRELVQKIVIPEMSKNRALQRVTNEISMEVNAL